MLVRHGQAAAFTADSDRLTELGEAQGRALGAYLVRHDVSFDAVHTGTLRRQTQTERLVAAAYAEAGKPWPEPVSDPGWNEYDAGGVMGRLAPRLAERDPEFASLVEASRAAMGKPDQNRYFQPMFEAIMTRWVAGDIRDPEVESFADFHQRIGHKRDAIVSEGRGNLLAFTSGGPIGVWVQATLEAPALKAMQINWRVRNGSLTEFLFSRGRVSLDAFNRIPHLDDPALQSFR